MMHGKHSAFITARQLWYKTREAHKAVYACLLHSLSLSDSNECHVICLSPYSERRKWGNEGVQLQPSLTLVVGSHKTRVTTLLNDPPFLIK